MPRMCFLPSTIHSHRAENVMRAETLAVNVDHQNFDLVPPPLLQLLELLDAGLDRFPADRAARHPYRFRHLRQNFLIFPGGDAPQSAPPACAGQGPDPAEAFHRRGPSLRLRSCAAGAVVSLLPCGPPVARGPAAIRGGGSRRWPFPECVDPASCSALRSRICLQRLMANLMNHGLHDLAGALDQVDDGKQDLPVSLAELLDNGGRLARRTGHDVVRFSSRR